MLSALQQLDTTLTRALNGSHSLYADSLALLFTQTQVWFPLALVLAYILIRRQQYWAVLGVALCVLLSDQIASTLFKPMVCRYRPTQSPELMYLMDTVNGYRGGLYGFFSSHAANTASVAVFVGLLSRRKMCYAVLAAWVLLNCWTRVYLGVHYVGDLLCGLLCGVLVGWSVSAGMRRFIPSYRQALPFSDFESRLLTYAFLLTILTVSLYSMIYLA